MNELAVANVPSTDEMQVYMEQAKMLASSALVPNNFRGKPGDIMVAALTGRELGMGPIASLQYVIVINGKPTLNAEGRVALIRKRGHSITGSSTPERAVVTGRRADTGDEITVEWTIQMANRAGLVKNGPWKQYPEAMLWARAVSQLSRMLFADVFLGVSYDPSEIEDMDGGSNVVPLPSVEQRPAIEQTVTGQAVDTETGEIVDVVESSQGDDTPPPGPAHHAVAEPIKNTVDDETFKKRMAALHASLHEAFAVPKDFPNRAETEKAAKATLLAEYKVESAADLDAASVDRIIKACKEKPEKVREVAGLPADWMAGDAPEPAA